MITLINAKTIPDAWYQLLFNLDKDGYRTGIQSGSFEKEQTRLQYPGAAIYIEFPWMDMYDFIPEGSSIAPPTSRDYIENEYFPNYLMNPELAENETYKYASRINEDMHNAGLVKDSNNKWTTRTQLEVIIDILKKTPLTNQAVLEIAKPNDIVECIGNDGKLDPPCLRLIDFKVIPTTVSDADDMDYILTMSVYFRSWDLWAGLPSNLCGLELLKQYVASECNLINGPMYAYSAGLHIYGYQESIKALRLHKND